MNLWGESNMDHPSSCESSTFTALGGVTFGLITCADLIYRFPTLDLVDSGVDHYVAPVAWDDSMAQMQIMGWAQGFSLAHGVNLIVSNQRTSSESGSGAWSAGSTQSYTFAPSNKVRGQVSQVPNHSFSVFGAHTTSSGFALTKHTSRATRQ